MKQKKTLLLAGALVCAAAVAYLPAETSEMTREAWKFCGCFLFLLLALILKIMADYTAMLTTMALLCLCGACPFHDAAAAFSSSTIWLCIGVFLMGIGISNSGIGRRIALRILLFFPRTYRGNIAAMFTAGLVTTPIIPSSMAKTAIMAPVIAEVCKAVDAPPGSRKSFGIWFPNFMCTCQLGMAFLSGSTNTVLMIGFIGIAYSWLAWTRLALVWFLVCISLTCMFCLLYCATETGTNRTERENSNLQEQFSSLGCLDRKEKQGFIIVSISLLLFLTQSVHGIPPEIIALLAVSLFSFCGLLSPEDACSKGMWTTVIFVGGMLGLSDLIQKLGIGEWISGSLSGLLPVLMSSVWLFVPLLCVTIYLARYILSAPLCCATVFISVLSPLVERYGISRSVMVFVVWTASCCWNAPYTNPAYVALIGMTNGAIDEATARKGSYVYCAINLIALTASIPLWQNLSLC